MPEEPEHPHRRSSDVEIAMLTQSVQYMGAQIIGVEKAVEEHRRSQSQDMKEIKLGLAALREEDLPRRVAKLEGMWDWFVRIVVGAVLLALLGLVVTNGQIGGA